MAESSNRNIMFIVIALVVGVLAWAVLTMPDKRTSGQRIGDAVDALPQGIGNAAEQLEDRTPGEKIGDAVEDAGQGIKNATSR